MRDQGTCSLLGRFIALLFLPEAMIPSAFRKLKRKATSATLQRFAADVEKTWITIKLRLAAIHLERILTVYSHKQRRGRVALNGLNRRAQGKSQLPLYLLIALFHEESSLTNLQIRIVSERKLSRIQRKTYRQLQSKIFSLWDQYENGERAIKQLLRACSELYGPREEPCSLWARANTKMAPLGATLSLKVMTNRMCSVV